MTFSSRYVAFLSLILNVREGTKAADGAAFAILVNSRIYLQSAQGETWHSRKEKDGLRRETGKASFEEKTRPETSGE